MTCIAAVCALSLVGAATLAEDRACAASGVVTDAQGKPAAGVVVTALPGKTQVTTGAGGGFCFEDLSPGTHVLLVHHERLGDARRPIEVSSSGPPVRVELVLESSFREEVVVTATRTEQRLEDVPVRVQLVPREAIEQTAARTLAEAVEFSPGVRTENSCQNCNFSQIRLLGLEGPYTQILIDGQPILSGLSMVYGIEHIPARLIDRLEIVKGGGSALYGAGSVAGVVNVVTGQPRKTHGNLELRRGWSAGEPTTTVDGGADWVSPSGATAVSAYGQVDRIDAIDVDGDGFSDQSRRDMEAYGARVYRDVLGERGQLILDFAKVSESRRGGDNLDAPVTETRITEAVDTERTTFAATWSHRLSDRFWYRATASHALTERDTYYGAGGDPNAFGVTHNPLTVLDAQANLVRGSHLLTAGLQYERDALEDSQPAYGRRLEETYSNVGLFFQDEYSIGNTWSLVGGARADRHSELESAVVSPRFAVRYKPARSVNVRFSWATGFLAPEVFNEDLHIEITNGAAQVIRNDPDLDEESSTSYSLGLEWFPRAGGSQLRLEGNLFLTDIRDSFQVIERDDPATPEQTEFFRVNGSGSRVHGVELNAAYARSGIFSVDAGVVFQRAEYDVPEPDFGSLQLHRTPDTTGVMSFTWRAWRPWQIFAGIKYTGSMKIPHYAGFIGEDRLETTDPFLTLDASLSRRIPLDRRDESALRLTLGAKNLTDEFQDDLDRGPNRDSGYVYGPSFPRTIYTSVELEF
jgi:outer membrane receptor for ferrienterochelin and colicins